MFNYLIKAGTTNVSVTIRIIDSTDGTPETGVVYNTAGIDLEYRREGAVSTDITEATLSALTDAHSDGGVLHIGNGYYRLDLPDAACAAGATGVLVHGVVTGMIVIGCYIQLVTFDPFDTVRLGLTALPNAAADAAGGLPISDAGGLDLDAQIKTDIDAILVDTGTDGSVVTTPAYLGSWKIGDYLTFTVATRLASTGALTDADAVPSYRIYEDEVGYIFGGDMSLLDNVNTVGLYSERVQLTANNGFEKGRSYNMYIRATVGGIIGGLTLSFQIEAEVDSNIVSDKTGYALTTAPPTIAEIIAGITDGSLDLQEMMRIIIAAVAGKSSGGGSATVTFRDSADSKNRITATLDANQNRTGIILDGS